MAEAQQRTPKPPDPCAMVIFGAGGDLTKRLLVPALYNLARSGLLPENFALIGVDRVDQEAALWTASLRTMLQSFVGDPSAEDALTEVDDASWQRIVARAQYVRGDLTDAGLYHGLAQTLEGVRDGTDGNVLFYLAVADRFFGDIVTAIGQAGLADEAHGWRRVVIEKPFGHDLPSARALNETVLKALREEQVYRIDHFLGKETVQNIMAFRFANGLFEPVWNRDRIDHVQITVAETVGVEGRGGFYETAGALRDMVPNHVFQLVAMVAMEPPVGFDAEAVRSKKADVFRSIMPIDPDCAVRGQYGAGTVLHREARAYHDEPNVAHDSNIETYVALKFFVDNWRWAGVPFYLRTGKHMSRRTTEISIRFKGAPHAPFEDTPTASLPPNWLVLQIQPDEGMSLQFEAKRPGPLVELAPVRMEFRYADWFKQEPNVGYETLVYDVMIGDQTLFQRADQVEAAWRIVQPVLDHWGQTVAEFPNYASGTDGPDAAVMLIAKDGDRAWRPVAAPERPHGARP